MVREGMAWVDDMANIADKSSGKGVQAGKEDEGKIYWFPSIMEKGKEEEKEDLALINNK